METHKTNKTRIKLICYYSHRSCGTPYSVYEIQRGMNRKPHDIYETEFTKDYEVRIREDKSIKKALRHVELHEKKIISAIIILNAWKTEEEWTIGKWTPTQGWNFVMPTFSPPDLKGNIFITNCKTLRIDKMRKQIYELQKRIA